MKFWAVSLEAVSHLSYTLSPSSRPSNLVGEGKLRDALELNNMVDHYTCSLTNAQERQRVLTGLSTSVADVSTQFCMSALQILNAAALLLALQQRVTGCQFNKLCM